MGSHIAVIDVGKTNKKVIVYDEHLAVVDSAYQGFPEYVQDGVHLEDLDAMTAWIKGQLAVFARRYQIAAVSVTTHGATMVCIDANGRVVVPPVAYTTEPPEDFDEGFYRLCGDARDLQRTTATAAFGLLINLAKGIYFAQQHYPDQFAKVATILSLPQYFGYVLTGCAGAEPTYLGCHTYLFDFARRQYSSVTDRLGVRDRLAPLAANSWSVLGNVSPAAARETGLSTGCIVTMGIHDSNSSLLPYLVKGHRNFVLNSTGTWCVAMHPCELVDFKEDEIGKLVFYNLDAFFNPVKTSIFMGGQEFDTYAGLLKQINGRSDIPPFDRSRCERVLAERRLFILPSVVRGTGLFPDSRPRAVEDCRVFMLDEITSGRNVPAFFRDYETAFAVLNVSLALQTSIALSMAGFVDGGDIFTEGGFRKNDTYNALMAALYPTSHVALTQLAEATAFGAALLAKAALLKGSPMDTRGAFEIQTTAVVAEPLPAASAYAAEFRRRLTKG
jgi:sugar (pentulose or hexulose) kinase